MGQQGVCSFDLWHHGIDLLPFFTPRSPPTSLFNAAQNPPHRAHVLLGINAANYLISQGHTVDRSLRATAASSSLIFCCSSCSVHFVPGSDNYQWNKIKLKTNSTTELTMADKLTYSMSARVELLNVLISGEPAPEGFSLVADDFEGTIPECFEVTLTCVYQLLMCVCVRSLFVCTLLCISLSLTDTQDLKIVPLMLILSMILSLLFICFNTRSLSFILSSCN